MPEEELLKESLQWIDALMREIEHPQVANTVWYKENLYRLKYFRGRLQDRIGKLKRKGMMIKKGLTNCSSLPLTHEEA